MDVSVELNRFQAYMKRYHWGEEIDSLRKVRLHLDGITIRPGYELAACQVGNSWGSHFQTYVHRKNAKEIWDMESPLKETQKVRAIVGYDKVELLTVNALDYFEVPMTEKGIAHAWALDNLTYFMPLYWHAGYIHKEFIFRKEHLAALFKEGRDEVKGQVMALDRKTLLPKVKILDEFNAEIEYCYWNDWTGLVRCREHALSFDGHVSFECPAQELLVRYRSGLVY